MSHSHSDSSSMDGMDMSSTMSGRMDASQMNMVFFTSSTTPLLSAQWVPTSMGQYAGTCIFLIVLAFLYRGSFALKHVLETRWLQTAVQRRYVVVADQGSAATRLAEARESKEAILSANGVEERVRVVEQRGGEVQPFRFSVDLPRAGLVTVMVGVGYLLMLAVMTMNVGYFLSILGGAFAGELAFGRLSSFSGH